MDNPTGVPHMGLSVCIVLATTACGYDEDIRGVVANVFASLHPLPTSSSCWVDPPASELGMSEAENAASFAEMELSFALQWLALRTGLLKDIHAQRWHTTADESSLTQIPLFCEDGNFCAPSDPRDQCRLSCEEEIDKRDIMFDATGEVVCPCDKDDWEDEELYGWDERDALPTDSSSNTLPPARVQELTRALTFRVQNWPSGTEIEHFGTWSQWDEHSFRFVRTGNGSHAEPFAMTRGCDPQTAINYVVIGFDQPLCWTVEQQWTSCENVDI